MKIFLYEYSMAGGAWDTWDSVGLADDLAVEGGAMFRALATDLERAGHKVLTMPRSHDGERRKANFAEAAHRADAAIVVAPEIGGILMGIVATLEAWDRWLLSPGSEFVHVASHKHRTAEQLARFDVPVARGILQPEGLVAELPWSGTSVCKPVLGAGSWLVQRFELSTGPLAFDARLEPVYPGLAASVAVLCGPGGPLPLAACRQHLGGESGFCYQGGSLPLECHLAARAQSLARRAIQAMPETSGYVGIDLILGGAEDGSEDVVIEINPRLTTSYVGLRRAYNQNLAEAWIDVARGEEVELSNPQRALEFLPDGSVTTFS